MRYFKVFFLFVAFAAIFTVVLLWLLGPPPWRLNSAMLDRGKERAAMMDQAARAFVAQAAGTGKQSAGSGAQTPDAPVPGASPTSARSAQAVENAVSPPAASPIETVAEIRPSPTVPIPDTPGSAPTTVGAVATLTPTPVAEATAAPGPSPTVVSAPPTPMPPPPDGLYTVQDGDTLASIAARYGTSAEVLLAANDMDRQQFIWLGQRLQLPAPGQPAKPRRASALGSASGTPASSAESGLPSSKATVSASTRPSAEGAGPGLSDGSGGPAEGDPVVFTVRKGDYLAAIAKTYNTTVAAIAAANNITNPSYIEVGMQLIIPSGAATLTSTVPAVLASPATVQPGEKTGLAGNVVLLTASGKDIYVVRADGSDLKRLTIGLDPALSSDGQSVVFARWGEQEGIYAIRVDGTEERLVYSVHQPRQPVWSPDGSQIAFSFQKGEVTTETRDRDGKSHRFTDLFWRVAVVGVDGKGFTELPCKEHSSSPTWSADGKFVVFAGDQGLTVSNPGGFYRELTHGPWHLSPSFSPDGSRIAFMIKQADHFDLFVRPVRDLFGEQTSLTSNKGVELTALTSPPRYTEKPVNNVAPAWSPDGAQIAFLSDRDGSWQIYVMNADGGNQRKLFESVLSDLRLTYDFASERSISWGR